MFDIQKFVEYVDRSVQIIYAKFDNDREKDSGCRKTRIFFFSGTLLTFGSFHME